jgi:hypothetical protein
MAHVNAKRSSTQSRSGIRQRDSCVPLAGRLSPFYRTFCCLSNVTQYKRSKGYCGTYLTVVSSPRLPHQRKKVPCGAGGRSLALSCSNGLERWNPGYSISPVKLRVFFWFQAILSRDWKKPYPGYWLCLPDGR